VSSHARTRAHTSTLTIQV